MKTNKTKIKGCIFDLDGTLLDTITDIADAMNKVLSTYGFNTHSVEKYKTFVGSGTTNLISRAVNQEISEGLKSEILKKYNVEYNNNILVKTCPYTGITEQLKALEEKGMKLAVLSNKPDKSTKFLIDKCFADIDFVTVRGQLPDVPIKPDPKAALDISEEMKIAPEEIAFIGDSPEDFITGKNAGMLSISVLWGYRSKEQLSVSGAGIFCEKPDDILKILITYL